MLPVSKLEQTQTAWDKQPLHRGIDGPVSVMATLNVTRPRDQDQRLLRIYLSNFLPTAVSNEIPAPADLTLTLTLPSGGALAATATVQRIDNEHANPFELWMSWPGDNAQHPWHGPVSDWFGGRLMQSTQQQS